MTASNYACKIFFLAISLTLVAGCTVLYVPKPNAIEANAIPDIAGRGTLSLINDQDDNAVRELGKAGWGTMRGDLRSWTQAAIARLKLETEKRGLRVQPGGEKLLKVKVSEAELGVSGLNFAGVAKCKVRMKIETGNGYVADVNQTSNALSPPGSCDTAMAQAIVSVLNDAQIRAYLSQ